MAIEKVFIDDETGAEMRCFFNTHDKIFISITDREDPFQQMYVELTLEDAGKLVDHLNHEIGMK